MPTLQNTLHVIKENESKSTDINKQLVFLNQKVIHSHASTEARGTTASKINFQGFFFVKLTKLTKYALFEMKI